jgi:hypothetical protein
LNILITGNPLARVIHSRNLFTCLKDREWVYLKFSWSLIFQACWSYLQYGTRHSLLIHLSISG